MKKKLLTLLLVIACITCGAAGFTACGNKENGDKPASALVLNEAVTVVIDANSDTELSFPANLAAGAYTLTASGLTAEVAVSVGNSESASATLSASNLTANITVAAGESSVSLTNKAAKKIQFKLKLTAGKTEPGDVVFALDTELTFTVPKGEVYKLDLPGTIAEDQYTIAVIPTAELEGETVQALAGENTSGGYINASHKYFVKDGKTLWFENVYLDSTAGALYFGIISNQSKDFKITVVISKGATDFNGEKPSYAFNGLNETLSVIIPAGEKVNITLPANLAADNYSVLISPYASIGRKTVEFTVGSSTSPQSVNALSGWKSVVALQETDGYLTFSMQKSESDDGDYMIFVKLSAAVIIDETIQLEAQEMNRELALPENFAGGTYTIKLTVGEELQDKTFFVWVDSLGNDLVLNAYNNFAQAVNFSASDTAIYLTSEYNEACTVEIIVVAGTEIQTERDLVLDAPAQITVPADKGEYTLNLPDNAKEGTYTVTLGVSVRDYMSSPVFELSDGISKITLNFDNDFTAEITLSAGTSALTIVSANGNSYMIDVTLSVTE